jgi:hypothetical protein
MDISSYRKLRTATTDIHISSLEIAPQGWRHCVDYIAEGISHWNHDRDFCVLCEMPLDGAQGHDATCLTMVARRILANEPLLRTHCEMAVPDEGPNDVSGARNSQSVSLHQRVNRQTTPSYVIPRFLKNS